MACFCLAVAGRRRPGDDLFTKDRCRALPSPSRRLHGDPLPSLPKPPLARLRPQPADTRLRLNHRPVRLDQFTQHAAQFRPGGLFLAKLRIVHHQYAMKLGGDIVDVIGLQRNQDTPGNTLEPGKILRLRRLAL